MLFENGDDVLLVFKHIAKKLFCKQINLGYLEI